jgi:hypothetical protein
LPDWYYKQITTVIDANKKKSNEEKLRQQQIFIDESNARRLENMQKVIPPRLRSACVRSERPDHKIKKRQQKKKGQNEIDM